jgi:hypothetical protein
MIVADSQSAIEEDVELRGALDSLLDESSGL